MPPNTSLSARERAEHRHQTSLLIDRVWLALAALAEAPPDNIVTKQLLSAAPSVQHLSLRNQITLLVQSGERQIALRDVDTEQGWARRGRMPNQSGLRVVRPHDAPGRAGGRRLFRVSYRWEFTQTAPLGGDVLPQIEPCAAGDSAEFAENLIDQLSEHGYRVTPAPATTINHEAQRIAIDHATWHSDPVSAVSLLIPALAHALITAPGSRHDMAGGPRAC
jgi:hypothetical protein